ncbi:uncharacterized protein METZ01_LOCUS154685 [marine metagenome]|uniref:Uncharacterized protein n=1 Tax=marine metagenome TaxID=408172 RepID=A0A382AKR0_9ZZZZ
MKVALPSPNNYVRDELQPIYKDALPLA